MLNHYIFICTYTLKRIYLKMAPYLPFPLCGFREVVSFNSHLIFCCHLKGHLGKHKNFKGNKF